MSIVRFGVRLAAFLGAFAAAYMLVLYVAINVASDRLRFTNIPMSAPPRSETLLTFRDLQGQRDVNVLFLGSSHANRSFDPRSWDRHGVRSFTLGTLSQSPLNTAYLLRDHLARLRPALVVFEVYWGVLASDGAESAIDLIGNTPLTANLVRMALATRNVRVLNTVAWRVLDRNRPPLGEMEPELRPGDTYRGRGFIERALGFEGSRQFPRDRIDLAPRQLRYLERCLQEIRAAGAAAVLVVQPLPGPTISAIANYAHIDRTMRELANRNDVPYIDFNQLMWLESTGYFYDYHHLNQRGVERFMAELFRQLESRGLVQAAAGVADPAPDAS